MRFMIIVKGDQATERGEMPSAADIAEMGRYHEELAAAGVLLDAAGLKPTSQGWRVQFSGGRRTVIDGPFTEGKELVAGYTLIEVRSREEAEEWVRRFPCPGALGEGAIEVRQLFALEDFEPGAGVDLFRRLDLPSQR